MVRFLSQRPKLNLPSKFLKDFDFILLVTELIVADKFKLTPKEIKRMLYEVYFLKEETFLKDRFASLLKLEKFSWLPSQRKEFYILCLNQTKIFNWKKPFLNELLFYILSHELIHLVRFIRYQSDFYAKEKWEEEKKVHNLTKETLKDIKFLPHMKVVLDYFDQIYQD
ncbi:MAG: hypothetical protein NZ530_07270 [Thermodesulfobacteriaceae bacterium]|nr:hypothetical protein [Thermodesulfobacteriaceae bacterium]MDW8136744.1 hypothetical protein [Thermodesulfobacterium sp.]